MIGDFNITIEENEPFGKFVSFWEDGLGATYTVIVLVGGVMVTIFAWYSLYRTGNFSFNLKKWTNASLAYFLVGLGGISRAFGYVFFFAYHLSQYEIWALYVFFEFFQSIFLISALMGYFLMLVIWIAVVNTTNSTIRSSRTVIKGLKKVSLGTALILIIMETVRFITLSAGIDFFATPYSGLLAVYLLIWNLIIAIYGTRLIIILRHHTSSSSTKNLFFRNVAIHTVVANALLFCLILALAIVFTTWRFRYDPVYFAPRNFILRIIEFLLAALILQTIRLSSKKTKSITEPSETDFTQPIPLSQESSYTLQNDNQ